MGGFVKHNLYDIVCDAQKGVQYWYLEAVCALLCILYTFVCMNYNKVPVE